MPDSPAAVRRGTGGRGTDGRGAVERRSGERLRVPAVTVLWHPDLARVGDRVRLDDLLRGRAVDLGRGAPAFAAPGRAFATPLAHESLDGLRLRLAPAPSPGGLTIAAAGGGADVRIQLAALDGRREIPAEQLAEGVVVEIRGTTVLLVHALSADEAWEPADFDMVGESEGLVEMRREIRRVADLEVPVLLRGETGTGKELMARAIHRHSRRRERPYLTVNPAAIPPSLAAAELFGAAKGAFTGAVQAQVGYFARADGGTLFLDEIGEAPPEVQAMLLRVLDLGEIQPLGTQETQTVDVRLVAATDVDLEEASDGAFRMPLFHRLATYQIVVPTLRTRRDDFGRLLVAFLRREMEALGEAGRLEHERVLGWLPTSVVARLACHPWPGNVRQLENAVRQIAIGSRGGRRVRIGPQLDRLLREAVAVTRPLAAAAEAPAAEPAARSTARREYRLPSEVGRDEVVDALQQHHWAIKPAAEELGVSRSSLYALIDHMPEIRTAAELEPDEILAAQDACAGDLHAMSERLEVSLHGLQQRMSDLGIRS